MSNITKQGSRTLFLLYIITFPTYMYVFIYRKGHTGYDGGKDVHTIGEIRRKPKAVLTK